MEPHSVHKYSKSERKREAEGFVPITYGDRWFRSKEEFEALGTHLQEDYYLQEN